jgi:uncharacterized membrane protein
MNIAQVVLAAMQTVGMPPEVMSTPVALAKLEWMQGAGAVANAIRSGKLSAGVVNALAVLGGRAARLRAIAEREPVTMQPSPAKTLWAGDMPAEDFGRVITPILTWAAQEAVDGRLTIADLDGAVSTMVVDDQTKQSLWSLMPPGGSDPLLKAAFSSYLRDSGFNRAFGNAIQAVKGAVALNAAANDAQLALIDTVSRTLQWVSLKAPFDMLVEKVNDLKQKRAATAATIEGVRALANRAAAVVTDQERADINALYSDFAAIDTKAKIALVPVGLWGEDQKPLSGLGVLAVFQSVAATVALCAVGAAVALAGMYVVLQVNASSKAEELTNGILARADALYKAGKITEAEYRAMIGQAVAAGEAVRKSAGASAALNVGGLGLLLAAAGAGVFLYMKSKKKA